MFYQIGKLKNEKEAEFFMKFVEKMLDKNYICIFCKNEEISEFDEAYRGTCENCFANYFNEFIVKK